MSKAERTRQFIIEKSAPLFNRKGMAGTSISDIMEVTGLAKGGVYGNFENKEQICAEAFDHIMAGIRNSISAELSKHGSYREKLLALFAYYKSTLKGSQNYGCPMLNFGVEADDTNPEMRERVAKAASTSVALIADLVRKGIAAGELPDGINPGEFSVRAFAMIEGAIWMSRVQRSSRPINLIIDALKKEIS